MAENKDPIPLSAFIGLIAFLVVAVLGIAAIGVGTVYLLTHNHQTSLSTHLTQ